ncbi:glycosyltransferase [uncultured Fibrobacter sp.]|uniref:glycosyltransferase n=1 Tax=uncultured Fibrobacter sp. TaxID=261512 RepID=UPI0025953ADE|nr:glycosyltransferase [uncultured Fibrobacter sp.]
MLRKNSQIPPDIVHIHAIGPALFVPLFRLTGAKVIYTHHGQDYMRAKWGRFAKFVLKMGERLGTRFSHRIIVISNYIDDCLKRLYKTRRTVLIRNGVEIRTDAPKDEAIALAHLGIEPKKYILACGRFVEEKGFHDLIEAYQKLPENCRGASHAGPATPRLDSKKIMHDSISHSLRTSTSKQAFLQERNT